MKYRLLEKDTMDYITLTKSKIFDALLLAYGVPCLECQNASSILLQPVRTGARKLLASTFTDFKLCPHEAGKALRLLDRKEMAYIPNKSLFPRLAMCPMPEFN